MATTNERAKAEQRCLLQLQARLARPALLLLAVRGAVVADVELALRARLLRVEEDAERLEAANAPLEIEVFRAAQVLHAFVFLLDDLLDIAREESADGVRRRRGRGGRVRTRVV